MCLQSKSTGSYGFACPTQLTPKPFHQHLHLPILDMCYFCTILCGTPIRTRCFVLFIIIHYTSEGIPFGQKKTIDCGQSSQSKETMSGPLSFIDWPPILHSFPAVVPVNWYRTANPTGFVDGVENLSCYQYLFRWYRRW